MRVTGVIQARMASTRLPGKVLKELAGRTVLGWVIRAAQSSEALDEVVVATTSSRSDDPVVAEAARCGAAVHRGSVDDVLGRFVGVVREHPSDAVVRLTADCPLLDPSVIRAVARVGRVLEGIDYISTALPRTLPRGLDVELVTTAALVRADREADQPHHRTHVTSYLYSTPGAAQLLGLTFQPDRSRHRLTLDTGDDWNVIRQIAAHFGDRPASLDAVVAWLDENPEVAALNAAVQQKPLRMG